MKMIDAFIVAFLIFAFSGIKKIPGLIRTVKSSLIYAIPIAIIACVAIYGFAYFISLPVSAIGFLGSLGSVIGGVVVGLAWCMYACKVKELMER